MEIYIKVKEKEILECNNQIEKLLKEDKSPVAKFQADMKDFRFESCTKGRSVL